MSSLEGDVRSERAKRAGAKRQGAARSWRDWWTILKETYRELGDDRVAIVAGGVSFYALLALFPALAALVSIYGLFAEPETIGVQLQMLSDVLPGDVLDLIGRELSRIAAASDRALGFGFALGLLLSLWSANAGVKAIFDALNIVCEENETRGFFMRNALSLSFTLASILIALVAIATVVALPIALDFIGLKATTERAIKLARWPLLLLAVGFVIAALYRYGPSRDRPPWPWLTWGGAAASFLWLAAAVLFSWYVGSFANYNKTYGSLGTVIGLMMWNWLSVYIVLAGAELNSEIENHETGVRRVSVVDPEDPFPPYMDETAATAQR